MSNNIDRLTKNFKFNNYELGVLNNCIAKKELRIYDVREFEPDLIIEFLGFDGSHYRVLLVDFINDLYLNQRTEDIISRVNKLVPDFKFSIADIGYIDSSISRMRKYFDFVAGASYADDNCEFCSNNCCAECNPI